MRRLATSVTAKKTAVVAPIAPAAASVSQNAARSPAARTVAATAKTKAPASMIALGTR
jgi:hypothetical protein